MKTLTQYREDIKNLLKKVDDVDAQCTNEGRDLTDSEFSLKNEMLDQVERLRQITNTMERQERIVSGTRGPSAPAQTVTIPDKPVDTSKKDRFNSLGAQLMAVINAGKPGGQADPRLFNATGMGESVPSDGGFLVQQDFTAQLLEQAIHTGVLVSRVRQRYPISGNSNGIKINGVDETSRASTRYGGIKGYWADEADEKQTSKPKFRRIELSLKKLIGLCYATDELMADAGALEAFIRQAFAGEFGFLLDDAIVNGVGAGQPLGFMNAGCLVTVDKEDTQTANTILPQNIVNMYARRFAGQSSNYVWLYNQTIEPQLFTMTLDSGTAGTPIFMPPGGLSQSPYATILGRPAIAIEQAQALGTAGDLILANIADGYVMAEKGGMQSAMSIHVRFVYDESAFRFVLRVDGQPVRASALTPYKGGASATQSHFVVLETRS